MIFPVPGNLCEATELVFNQIKGFRPHESDCLLEEHVLLFKLRCSRDRMKGRRHAKTALYWFVTKGREADLITRITRFIKSI